MVNPYGYSGMDCAGTTVKLEHSEVPESNTLYCPAAKVKVNGEEPAVIAQPPLQPQEPYTLKGELGPALEVIVNG